MLMVASNDDLRSSLARTNHEHTPPRTQPSGNHLLAYKYHVSGRDCIAPLPDPRTASWWH
ncbi:hypothetical protein K431DRAFT_283038 [Polychaeton citri CBS 116435]|uniref:Uncharacterized protein n=1 Tax=Polychaeton citri CBS 116435 TaxID=1314669 RepID=A0A9P4QBN6_9PEZI|nr:hypothetical protein K431DRAFT_283038 [Polychaeton citri CBS 116435]